MKLHKTTMQNIPLFFLCLLFFHCAHSLRHKYITENITAESLQLNYKNSPAIIWEKKLKTVPKDVILINRETALICSYRGEFFTIDLETGKKSDKNWKPLQRPVQVLSYDSESGIIHFSSFRENNLFIYDLGKAKLLEKRKCPGIRGKIARIKNNSFMIMGDKNILLYKNEKSDFQTIHLHHLILHGLFQYKDNFSLISKDGYLRFYDISGKEIKSIDLKVDTNPIVCFKNNQLIICDSHGKVVIYSYEREQIIFEKQFPVPVYSVPLLLEDKVIIGLSDGIAASYDIKSDTLLWKYQGEGLINSPVIGDNNYVFLPFARGKISCINIASGQEQWTESFDRNIRFIKLSSRGLLAITQGRKIFCLGYR